MLVSNPLIGAEQANLRGDGLANKLCQRGCANILNDAGNHIALTSDCASDSGLTRTNAASSVTTAALVPMPVLGFAADECFVHLNDAHELAEIFVTESGADTMAHVPSRPVRAEAHHAMDLERANALLAGEHEMDDAEPVAQRLIRVLENRSGDMRETVIGFRGRAFVAEPIPRHLAMSLHMHVAATRAGNTLRPAMPDQIRAARIFVRERPFPLGEGQLMDRLNLLGAGHTGSPSRQEPI